jgi:hypothetical protein
MYGGMFSGRNGFDIAESPHWPSIDRAMHDCLGALSDIGIVLQDRVIDDPAPLYDIEEYLSYRESSLIKNWNSQAVLPAVPTAIPQVLVKTGRRIPCGGIWEPVKAPGLSGTQKTRGGRKFELADSWDVDGLTLEGEMNYLHRDFKAPTFPFENEESRSDGRPTTWRLIWEDDRYGDKPVPEEESGYVFVQPVPGEVLFGYS